MQANVKNMGRWALQGTKLPILCKFLNDSFSTLALSAQ